MKPIEEVTLLYEITNALNEHLVLKKSLYKVLDILSNSMNMVRGTITILNPLRNEINIEVAHGMTRNAMERVKYKTLENDELKAMLYEIAPEDKIKLFEETGDVDFGYEIPGIARYRSNFFMQKYGVAAVFRQIPEEIMTVEQLGLPMVIPRLAQLPRGLVLVTGPTGSGKSTTLAAIIDEANRTRKDHILTIEDPVEFDLPYLNQTQINSARGLTFEKGLTTILRQDPEIIMVGEIRDGETAGIAFQAAQTGHLVFSTLHTNDSLSAVSRLLELGVDPFLVSDSLEVVLAQRLVRKTCPQCKFPFFVLYIRRSNILKPCSS